MSPLEKITIPWQDLRPWDGSVRKAFEQLCNQFASFEPTPAGSSFTPVAAPDGGVEAYWTYPDETERGFQAKFWTAPDQVDFAQIDKSITRALDTHPNLTQYTLCLPIDRQDPRTPGKSSLKDAWNKHVLKWNGWAKAKARTVLFDYWGETELTTRFSEERHAGRYFFWFHKELFSDAWFAKRLDEAEANAGARYTPDLNVELDLSQVFYSLVRKDVLSRTLKGHFATLRKMNTITVAPEIKFAAVEIDVLRAEVGQTLAKVEQAVGVQRSEPINWKGMEEAAAAAIEAGYKLLDSLRAYEHGKKTEYMAAQRNPDRVAFEALPHMMTMHSAAVRRVIEALHELQAFTNSDSAFAANAPAALLVGIAGAGKTHLLCDFALGRLGAKAPAILLLGQHFFSLDNPWNQVLSQLGLKCSPDELLGALNAAGQTRGEVAVLIIDALNEGQGRRLWQLHLAGFLESAKRYPFVKLVLSVRRSYLEACIPKHITEASLLRVEHQGFADNILDAVNAFFDHYGIVLPTTPILNPEFKNPLFLKLFCQGFRNRGMHVIPKGLTGLSAVFSFFIDSVNEKLSMPESLDFDIRRKLVQQATDHLADAMSKDGLGFLTRAEADGILQQICPSKSFQDSLLRHLISEGLLNEDMLPGEHESEIIRFAYERLSDFLIATKMLKQSFDPAEPTVGFAKNGPLGHFVETSWAATTSQGMIEAFTVLLPELYKVELAEAAPHAADYPAVRDAFTSTFILRDEQAFGEATLTYINKTIMTRESDVHRLYDAFIDVAASPSHPFNAKRLHNHLASMTMPNRDFQWTTFLWKTYGDQGALDRFINWATGTTDLSILSQESRELCGLALGWVLTSSNRGQRDNATKGLVRLFTDHVASFVSVLEALVPVNDPYVVERVLAVAYGICMRSTSTDDLKALAEWVYKQFFKFGSPPPNILIRDYARGIIEHAIERGVAPRVTKKNIRPPYKSVWPSDIPSRDSLEAVYGWRGGENEKIRRAWYPIYDSVMEDGDFARYVIGTNWGSFHWFSVPLSEPLPKGSSRHSGNPAHFNLTLAQCWIFNRVVELGWTPELFGTFDRNVSSSDRRNDKPERIGKKYQWIAYYEFVALVADHFHYAPDENDPGDKSYQGPWQVTSARNIDPSSLLKKDLADSQAPAWWAPSVYPLSSTLAVDDWLRDTTDIPDLSPMLQVTDPTDGSAWIVLETSQKVTDTKPLGEERFDSPFRQIWLEVRAYLVKKSDEERLYKWMHVQNFWGRWMPEAASQLHVCMGEFHWAPAYKAVDNYYHGHPGWSRRGQRELPVPVAQTTTHYLSERGFDCSIEESVNVCLPTKTLVELLNLRWSGQDGLYLDASGKPAVYDPTTKKEGPSALLVRRDLLDQELSKEGLSLVWMAFGGKEFMGARDDDWKGELQMNGAYRLTAGGTEGSLHGTYRGQHATRRSRRKQRLDTASSAALMDEAADEQ